MTHEKVKTWLAKGRYYKTKFTKMERQSELRNKYQQIDEAKTEPELFKRKKKEMPDAERVFSEQVKQKLYELVNRMGLKFNKDKTHVVQANKESFDFLGFTIRYDKDYLGRDKRYWNIIPSRKSEKKLRDKIRTYLKLHGHYAANIVARELNAIMRGWLNYFEIKGISYPAMSKRRLRFYLCNKLNRYYKRKSQRRCRLYGHNAFEALVSKYGLIDPTKYTII